MARIRNTSRNNVFGKGKEKILITDSGKEYIIRNSSRDNIYGDGKAQIIEEKSETHSTILPMWACVVIPVLFFLMFSIEGAFYPCLILIGICVWLSLSNYFGLVGSLAIIGMFVGLVLGAGLVLEGMNWIFTHDTSYYRVMFNWFGLVR